MDKGKKSEMTEERFRMLDQIGFTWTMREKRHGNWQERCIELQEFKERYGHCKVPEKYPGNPKLGKWCSSIRNMYEKNLEGKPSTLDENKIETLRDLGFLFNVASNQGDKSAVV